MRQWKSNCKTTIKQINETHTEIPPPEITRTETKSTFPKYELNPKVQRLKEKQEKISRLIVNACLSLFSYINEVSWHQLIRKFQLLKI